MKRINNLLIIAVIAGFLTTEYAISKTPSVYIVSVTNNLENRAVKVGLDIPRPGQPSKTSCATVKRAIFLWKGAIPGRKKEEGKDLMSSIVSKIERVGPKKQTLTWPIIPGTMEGTTLHLLVENVKQDITQKEPPDIIVFCYELKIDDDIKIEIETSEKGVILKNVKKKIFSDMIPKDAAAARMPNRFYSGFDPTEPFKYLEIKQEKPLVR